MHKWDAHFIKSQFKMLNRNFSLFTISNNSNLKEALVKALEDKNNFYIICDYTINKNYHMPKEEMDFLKSLKRKLNSFNYNSFEILDEKGIIMSGRKC